MPKIVKEYSLADYYVESSAEKMDDAVMVIFIEKGGRPTLTLGAMFPQNTYFLLNKKTPLGEIENNTKQLAMIVAYLYCSKEEIDSGVFYEQSDKMLLCMPLSVTNRKIDELRQRRAIPATVDDFFEKYW